MTVKSCILRTHEDNFNLEALIHLVGHDLHVVIWGGNKPHIGAVALAQPRKSLKNQECNSSTASVMCLSGHKEDVVVKYVAERLAAMLDRNVVATAGMHWDVFEEPDIKGVMDNVSKLTDMIIAHINS